MYENQQTGRFGNRQKVTHKEPSRRVERGSQVQQSLHGRAQCHNQQIAHGPTQPSPHSGQRPQQPDKIVFYKKSYSV